MVEKVGKLIFLIEAKPFYPKLVQKQTQYLSIQGLAAVTVYLFIAKLFRVPVKNDVILVNHWSIEMYTGLFSNLVSCPIIFRCLTSFFYRHYKQLYYRIVF